jgi:hypothetical protein
VSDPIKPCDLPCTKCGSTEVSRSFWPKDHRRQAREYGECSSKWTHVIGWNEYATREHLVHHCRCCHYEWQTLPMRAPKKPHNPARAEDLE